MLYININILENDKNTNEFNKNKYFFWFINNIYDFKKTDMEIKYFCDMINKYKLKNYLNW